MNQSLFKTRNGLIGICPPPTQQGDLTAVLFGGMVPFVLREFDEYHIVIGER